MLRYEEDMEAIIVLRNTAVGDFFDFFFFFLRGVVVFWFFFMLTLEIRILKENFFKELSLLQMWPKLFGLQLAVRYHPPSCFLNPPPQQDGIRKLKHLSAEVKIGRSLTKSHVMGKTCSTWGILFHCQLKIDLNGEIQRFPRHRGGTYGLRPAQAPCSLQNTFVSHLIFTLRVGLNWVFALPIPTGLADWRDVHTLLRNSGGNSHPGILST